MATINQDTEEDINSIIERQQQALDYVKHILGTCEREFEMDRDAYNLYYCKCMWDACRDHHAPAQQRWYLSTIKNFREDAEFKFKVFFALKSCWKDWGNNVQRLHAEEARRGLAALEFLELGDV
ncbi:MAG: hypothetical protein Q9159_002742 [Coniocarpon cinnabarinum]